MSQRPPWLPLGALLLREGLVTAEQLELALMDQQQLGWRLGEILVNWGWVSSSAIASALAEQYGMAFLDLGTEEVDEEAVKLISAEDAERYQAMPIRFLEAGVVLVAIADPTDVGACDELRERLGRPIHLAVADKEPLEALIAWYHGRPLRAVS
jgi:hypothetical protein